MEENDLVLTQADKNNFLETARWGKFLGIVGFIMSGFIVIGGLSFITGAFVGADFDDMYAEIGGAMGFFYILIALLYIFPSLYVYRFSTQIQDGIKTNEPSKCTEAYNNLRKLFLFMGVMTIIALGLYVLAIIFMVMGGLMGGML